MHKIGDFSKIVDIPVRTLRYYAEYGVLVPSEIDPFTGYKYYSDENVGECEFIKLLKSLDFTLDEIIEYKEGLQEDIKHKRSHGKEKETERERVLRRKYEKRNIRKTI